MIQLLLRRVGWDLRNRHSTHTTWSAEPFLTVLFYWGKRNPLFLWNTYKLYYQLHSTSNISWGWRGWLQLEYIIKQKAIKIHGSETVCWSYKNGALCLIFLIKKKKKFNPLLLSSPLLKAVWVFTILWQENPALHFKRIKASSVTATKSLSTNRMGLSRNGSICPWEDHRSNGAQSQFHIPLWVPPFNSHKQAG